jgi:hypothetical protein
MDSEHAHALVGYDSGLKTVPKHHEIKIVNKWSPDMKLWGAVNHDDETIINTPEPISSSMNDAGMPTNSEGGTQPRLEQPGVVKNVESVG